MSTQKPASKLSSRDIIERCKEIQRQMAQLQRQLRNSTDGGDKKKMEESLQLLQDEYEQKQCGAIDPIGGRGQER